MPIRPIDIRRKEFRNGFRGYDANQVDDFLDTVADEFERNYNENQRMREETNSLRERLQQFEDLEGSIRAALVHAEQAANDLRRSANREAEDVRQSARREAEFTVKDAQARSHQMLADSASRIERVQDSYEALQDAKRSFANDFRHLLKTYMEMMENMEVSSAREIEAALRERLDTESIAVVREAAAQQEPAGDPEDEEPAFGTTDAADLDDPAATRPIETVVASEGASDDEALQGTGPLADEPPRGDEETQVLGRGETMTFGPETDGPQTTPAAEDAPAAEPVATEPEAEPSAASGGTSGEPVDGGPGAADEVEREEPTLAEESRSHEFFDRENKEEEKASRISRASRFLRRRG
ncbi:MAG: DivIVA domain-containing protein [Actinomycetota bacterium]|nr:DivIVA domain-containing protein [Actinomycetota bacterium]